MTFRHVLSETAPTEPGLSAFGHLGEFDTWHSVGNIDALPLTALRADGLAYLSHLRLAPIATVLRPFLSHDEARSLACNRNRGTMASSDNWRTHRGGDCPVQPTDRVMIRFRNGHEEGPTPASNWRWRSWPEGPSDFDIVAWYRIT